MSVYRKDKEGNLKKIAGSFIQRFNNRWFLCTRSFEDGIEYYDIPQAALDYFVPFSPNTIYAFGFDYSNVTTNPKIRFGEKVLSIVDFSRDSELLNQYQLKGVFNMFTQDLDTENPKLYFVGDMHRDEIPQVGVGTFNSNIYFSNQTSETESEYKTLKYVFDEEEQEFTKTANNAEKLMETFLYDDQIGIDNISAGTWVFDLYCKVDNAANVTRFRFEPFLYHPDGTETNIFQDDIFSPDINNTGYAYIKTTYTHGIINIDKTDRFGIRVYMRTNRTSPTALYFKTGDGYASYFNIPIPLRHSQLREKNEEELYQHITLEEKNRLAQIDPSDFATESDIQSIIDTIVGEVEGGN